MSLNETNLPRVVVIAGGTQGLGKGIALYLAKIGVTKIIICGRSEENGEAVVCLVRQLGAEAYYVKADLSKRAGYDAVFEFCRKNFLFIEGLVYAAGISPRGTIESTTEALWDEIFEVNLKGAFFLIQKLLPLLRKGKNPSIVTICSFSSFCGKPELIAYNASKAALVTLTRSLANSFKKDRIRVNGINLGWTDTENERKTQNALGNTEAWLDEIAKQQTFGRLLDPQDAAYLVGFLLSQQSAMMTGSIIDLHQNVRV